MQAFNLTRLNFHSPYKVWIDNGSYKFLTDYGVQYRIEFVENNNIWEDEKAYEFGILNENKKNSPNDSKVKETVQSIIEEFFLTNPDILLYQCETGDSRQAMRARLFTRWFNEFDKRDRFCVKVSILRDEEVDNYIAIIVQKSNPKLTDILRDFDEFIGFFDTKPRIKAVSEIQTNGISIVPPPGSTFAAWCIKKLPMRMAPGAFFITV